MRSLVSKSGVVVVSALVAALLGACPKEQQGGADAGAATDASGTGSAHEVPGESAIAKLAADAVLLRVNGVAITKARFDQAVIQAGMAAGIPPNKLDATSKVAFERPAYEKLIERQLLVDEAKKRGLFPTLEEAKKATEKDRAELVSRLPPGKTFDDMLREMGTDPAAFDAELPSDLAIARLIEATEKTVPEPSEEELKKVYEMNRARLGVPETTSASHIMVALAEGATEPEVKAALDKATKLAAEAKGKSKEQFQKLADQKSDDPMVQKTHGDLGTFARGEMIPEVEEVAFKLKSGQVSAPVRSRAGYHVLFGHGVTAAHMREFAEVRTLLAQRERKQGLMQKMDELMAGLRAAGKVERLVEPARGPFDGQGRGPMQPPPPAPGGHGGAFPVPGSAPGGSPHGAPHGGAPSGSPH